MAYFELIKNKLLSALVSIHKNYKAKYASHKSASKLRTFFVIALN